MNDTQTALAIANNELPSPQIFGNTALFALRITGTGAAYREKWGEYVYRDPANYLNDEFLKRCNGLPVIFNHPDTDTQTLNSDNFADHIIGTIVHAYIVDNEVWGIARIYDANAVLSIIDDELSTSPTFVLSAENQKRLNLDGLTVLVEGKPDILDHVAVCKSGVWDKEKEPTGILINNEVLKMDGNPDLETPAADSDIPAAPETTAPVQKVAADDGSVSVAKEDLDRLLALIGQQQQLTEQQLHELNELKTALGGTQEAVAAQADANETAKGEMSGRLAAIEDKMKEPAELTDNEKAEVADAENESAKVAQAFGDDVRPAMRGEKPASYIRRISKLYQGNSQTYKGVNLDAIGDNVALGIAFKQICADSVTAASRMPRNDGKGVWSMNTDQWGRKSERVQGMDDKNSFAEFRIPARNGEFIQQGGR